MHKLFILLGACLPFGAMAQSSFKVQRNLAVPLYKVFEPEKEKDEWLEIQSAEMPKPGGQNPGLTAYQDARRAAANLRSNNRAYTTPPAVITPELQRAWEGLSGSGTPNDNHIAVANDGKVISVLNVNIRHFNDTGRLLKTWGLAAFARNPNVNPEGPIPNLERTYDPRVIYDQEADRWIVVFMNGVLDRESFTIVGFSTSSDPLKPWNVYRLPGNPFRDTTWSDYPIVALGKDDLFITLNQLKNGKGWKDGFTQSIIWQVNKASGYAGDSLRKNLWHDLKFNNKSIWSICPAQGGLNLLPHMHLLSVRPADTLNDTLFVHKIEGTGNNASYSLRVLKADKAYGYPPSALQPVAGFKLATNDARVLTAVEWAGQVHYGQNSIHPISLRPCIYHGILYGIAGEKLQVRSEFITSDSLDFAYPAIAAAGNDPLDPSVVITMVHSSERTFPGTSLIYANRYREYSPVVRMKEGRNIINYSFIPPGEQRWGDYEGIQKKYNEPNAYYAVGSYGNLAMNAYVARFTLSDGLIRQSQPLQTLRVFPNPADDHARLELKLDQESTCKVEMVNMLGQRQGEVETYKLSPGTHLLSVRTYRFAAGTYVLRVYNEAGTLLHSEKIIIR